MNLFFKTVGVVRDLVLFVCCPEAENDDQLSESLNPRGNDRSSSPDWSDVNAHVEQRRVMAKSIKNQTWMIESYPWFTHAALEKKNQKASDTVGNGKAMKWVDVENRVSCYHADSHEETDDHEFFTLKRQWGKHSLPGTFLVQPTAEEAGAKVLQEKARRVSWAPQSPNNSGDSGMIFDYAQRNQQYRSSYAECGSDRGDHKRSSIVQQGLVNAPESMFSALVKPPPLKVVEPSKPKIRSHRKLKARTSAIRRIFSLKKRRRNAKYECNTMSSEAVIASSTMTTTATNSESETMRGEQVDRGVVGSEHSMQGYTFSLESFPNLAAKDTRKSSGTVSDSDELQLSSPSSSGTTSKNKTKGKSKPKSKKSSSKSLSDDEEGSTEYTYATESDTGDTEASIKKASAASDRLLAEQEAKDKPSNDKSSPTYDEPGSYDSRSAFQPEPEDKRATNPYVNSWLSKKEKDKKLTKQEKKELKQKEKERKKQEKLAKKEAKSSKKNSKYLKANSSSQARSSSLAESRAAKKNEKSKTSQGKYTLGKNSGTLWSSSKDSSSKNKSATNEATTRSQSKEESSTPVSESDDKVVSKEGQTRTTKDQSKSAATASKTEKKDTTATGAKTPENIEEGSKSKEGSKDEEESDYTYVTESYTGSDEDSKQKSKSENEDAKSKSENEDAKSKSENEDAKSKSENEDAKSKSENEDAKSKSENEDAKSKSEDDEKKQSSKNENDSASKSADVDEQDSNKPSASVTASKTENAGGAKNGDKDDDTYTYTEISGDELVTATASKASKDKESKDQESQDVSKNSKNKEKSKSDAGSNEVSNSKGGSEDDGTYYYTYGSFKGSQDEDNSKETGSKTNERSGQESESKLAERSGQESKDDSNLKSNERTTKESRGEKNTPNRTDGKRARVTKRPGSKSSSERTSGTKSQSRSADTSKSGSKSAGRSASKDASKNKSKDQSGNEGKSGGGSKSDAKSGQKSKGDDDDDEEEYYYASETYSEQGSVSKTADSKSKDKKTSESKGSKAKDGPKNGSLSKSGRSADEERNDNSAGGKEKSVDKRVTNEKSKTATNSKALVKDSNDDESEYTYETEITHSGDETYKKPSKGTGSFTKSGNTASSASKNKVSNSNQYQKYSQLQSESYDDDLMRTMSGASGATSKDTASKSNDDRKRSKSDQKRSAQKSRTSRESKERGSREKGSLEKSKTSRKSKSSRESAKSGDSKSSRGSKTGRSGSRKKPGSERELKNQGGSRDSQDVEGKGTRTYNTETKSGFDDGGNPPPVTPPPPPDNLPDGDTYYETNGKNYKSGGTNDVPDFRSEFMGSDGNTDLDKHDTSKFKRSMQSNTAPGNNQDGNEGGSKKRGQGPNAGRIAEEEENANSKGPKDGKEKGQFSEGSIKAIGQIANKYEKKPLPEQQAETASSVTKDKSSETKGRTKPPSSYQKSKSTPSWDKDKGGEWDEGRPKNEDQNAQQGPNEVNNKEQQNQEAQQVEKQDGEQKDPNQENMQPEDPTQANDKQQDLNQNGERGPNQENKQNEMGEEGVKRSVQGDPNQAGQQDPNQAGQQNPDRAGLPDPNQAEVPDPNQLGNDANKEGQQSKDQNAQPERLQQNTGEQQRLSATSSKDIVQSNNPTSQKQSKSQLRGSAAPSKSDSPAGPDPGKRTSTGIDEDKPTEDLEEGGESNSASMDNQTSIGRSVTGSSYDKGSKRTPSWDKDSDDDGQKKEQEPAKGATDPDLNDWKASESDKKEEDNPEEDATYQDNVNPEDISKSMEGERTDEEGERTDDEREMDGQEGDGNGSDLRGSGQRSLSKSTSLDEGDSTGGEEEEARQSRKKTAGSKSKKSANQLRPEDAQSKVRFSDSEESQGRDSKMSKKKSKTAGKTSQKTSKSGAKSITPGERSRSGTPKKSALAKKESKASKLKSKASKTGPMAAKKSKLTNKKSKLTAMKSQVTSQGKAKTPPPTPPPRCPFDDEERIEGHSVATSNAVPFLPVQMMYRVHEDDSQSRSNYTLESLGINETRAPTDQDRFHHVKHPVFGYPKKPLTPPPPSPVKQKGDDLCAKCGNEINDPKNNKLHPMNPRSPEKGKKKDGSPIRKPRSPAGRGRKGNKGAGRGRGKGKGAAGKTKMMRLKPEDASNGSPPKSPGGGKRCGKKCNAAMFVGLSRERVKCCDKAFDCCATPFNTMPSQTPRSGPVIINTSDTQPTQGYSGPSYSFNTSSQGVTHSNEVCLTRCGESHHMLSPKSGKCDPNIRVVKSQTTIYSKPEYLPAVSPRDEVQMMTDDMYELPAPEKPPSTVSDSSLYNNRYVTNYIVDHEAPPPSPASQSGQVTPMSMTQNSPMSNNQYSPAQNSGANQFSPGQTSGRTPMSYGQYSQTPNAGGTPMTKSGVSPIDNYDSFPQQKRRPHSPGIPRTSNYSVESNPTWEVGPMQPSNRLTDQEPHYGCASDQSDHIVRSVRSSVNDQNIPRYQWPTYVSNRRKEITLLGEDPPPEGCEHESHTPRESVQTPYKTPRTPDPAMFPDTPDNPEMMGQQQWDSILHKEAQTSPSLRHGRSRSTASLLRRRSPQLREKLSPSISVEDLRTGEKQILMPQRNHDHSPNHVSNLNARDGNLSADTGDDNFMTARKSWTTDGGKPPPGHPAGRVPTQGVNSAQKTKHLGKQPEAPPSVPRLDEIASPRASGADSSLKCGMRKKVSIAAMEDGVCPTCRQRMNDYTCDSCRNRFQQTQLTKLCDTCRSSARDNKNNNQSASFDSMGDSYSSFCSMCDFAESCSICRENRDRLLANLPRDYYPQKDNCSPRSKSNSISQVKRVLSYGGDAVDYDSSQDMSPISLDGPNLMSRFMDKVEQVLWGGDPAVTYLAPKLEAHREKLKRYEKPEAEAQMEDKRHASKPQERGGDNKESIQDDNDDEDVKNRNMLRPSANYRRSTTKTEDDTRPAKRSTESPRKSGSQSVQRRSTQQSPPRPSAARSKQQRRSTQQFQQKRQSSVSRPRQSAQSPRSVSRGSDISENRSLSGNKSSIMRSSRSGSKAVSGSKALSGSRAMSGSQARSASALSAGSKNRSVSRNRSPRKSTATADKGRTSQNSKTRSTVNTTLRNKN